jgi:small-conductance mechanosensitive channel
MLKYVILDNPMRDWLAAAITAVVILFLTRITKAILIKQLKRLAADDDTPWYDITVKMLACIHFLFLTIAAVYAGTLFLSLPAVATNVFEKLFLIALLLQIGRLVSQAIRSAIEHYHRELLSTNAEAVTMLSSVSFLLRLLLWMILLLVALDSFGINITALIAGLGVGGVAVALAVQNILGDIFASFSIVLDKPFVIGDFIIIEDHMGTVEYVGLKTTRIRSLSGEQLIFANQDLLRSRIRNFKRMFERRVVFSIGVLYQTPVEKIEMIPAMIKNIIEARQSVRFDRAHFKEYGAFSLNFEIVYWVLNPDYNIYMDIQQAINLEIFKQFAQHGIEFAYPTQTLFLQAGTAPPPAA